MGVVLPRLRYSLLHIEIYGNFGLEIEINGQLISSGCCFHNLLYQALFDVTVGTDATNRRSLLQNAGTAAIPTANVNGQQYMIQNWLGFISSASLSILDTSLIGNCRLRITLTTPNALVQSAGCSLFIFFVNIIK